MSCKFEKIEPLPLGDFRVWFIVNGQRRSLGYSDDPINMQSIQEITEWEQVLHSIREVLFAYEDYQKAYNQNNQ